MKKGQSKKILFILFLIITSFISIMYLYSVREPIVGKQYTFSSNNINDPFLNEVGFEGFDIKVLEIKDGYVLYENVKTNLKHSCSLSSFNICFDLTEN